ncbi:NAD(P)-dependent oxidoreductase [Alteromonas halophila]|uniref:NAD(P)-dependent oxidoreductase n=1 Tax=Alteromonas halophila TaxID=516698 RepID=A0A918N001_9ALTE|nr:NAD(P)-dependent oxidoreductase [Alteromonas halophila]
MRAKGINAFVFTLGDDPAPLTEIADEATLVLNIPAGRRQQDLSAYQQHMCELIDTLADTALSHLIFTSTTSVYGDTTSSIVTEDTPPAPDTTSAHANAVIEAHLQRKMPKRYSILRLAGLTGPDRHPVHMLAGKSLDKGNKKINLIHSTDVVAAINVLIRKGPMNRVLHLSCTQHPKRGEYYTACAEKLLLPAPTFSGTDAPATGKEVDASLSLALLGLELKVPDPFNMC